MTLSHAFRAAGTLPVAAQFGVGLAFSVMLVGLWTLSNLAVDVLGQTRGLVCAWVCPWLRFAAWCYLTRDRDVQPAARRCSPAPDPDVALAAAPETLLLDLGPDDVGDDFSFDPEPEVLAVSETFGPASRGWFELPHREPPGPCPAEVKQDIELALTLAIREARAAAEGGAP